MSVTSYLEKAISELLAEDEKVRSKFYSQTDVADLEKLHQEHHSIKKWIGQLQDIQSELLATIVTAQAVPVKLPDGVYFVISRSDMRGKAYGIREVNHFKVLAGSFIAPKVVDNMYVVVKNLRRDNATKINADNLLLSDMCFDNPGQAARFVTGKQVNGIEEWETSDGIAYKEWSENRDRADTEETSENFAFKKPKTVNLMGNTIAVSTWRDVLVAVCETVYRRKPDVIINLPKDERMNSTRRATFAYGKIGIKVSPVKLSCGIWVEANQSASSTMRISHRLLSICGYDPRQLIIETQ